MALILNTQVGRDYHNAHVLATACEIAYLPADKGAEQYQSRMGMQAELVSVDNTQVYVAHHKEAIVIAFRGSEKPNTLDGFKDWLLTNAKNFLVLPEGRAGTDFVAAGVGARFHKGFLEALDEVWLPLITEVKRVVAQGNRPVWVTGHSLGGALAQLAGWRLYRNFVPVHQIYTFGSPMIGNDAAAEAFKRTFPGKIFRFIDTNDLVPKLPTVSLQTNEYKHCLQEVELGPKTVSDALQDAASKTVDGVMNATLIDEIWGSVHQGVDSHLMPNYLKRISEQLNS